jgi:uncharacterized phage-associated protein
MVFGTMSSFNERKATQLASAFIALSGGSLNHMKLIKLMYLADREALLRWDRAITGDAYFSLKHGPILSTTLSMISDGQNPTDEKFWFEYIAKSGDYEVVLAQPCPPYDLSQAEEELIHEVFAEYGHYDKWELVDHLHRILPEWQNPGNSAFPIYIEDILKAGGRDEWEVSQIESEIQNINLAKSLFGCD